MLCLFLMLMGLSRKTPTWIRILPVILPLNPPLMGFKVENISHDLETFPKFEKCTVFDVIT